MGSIDLYRLLAAARLDGRSPLSQTVFSRAEEALTAGDLLAYLAFLSFGETVERWKN